MGRLLVLVSLLACACGPSVGGPGDNNDGGINPPPPPEVDADPPVMPDQDANSSPMDASSIYDSPIYPDGGECNDWVCTHPVDDGCRPNGGDQCGDGLDNNCNGRVDEGCACEPGAVQPCFVGPPGRHGRGACVDGMQTCVGNSEFGTWGECVGGIRPGAEACDGQDNDCNGCNDDHPSCCNRELTCPSTMPDGHPFQDYIIDGTMFFPGPAASWQWDVTGGPCDRLLGNTSFTLTGQTTPRLTFHPTLSGDYTVHVRIVGTDGQVYECTFIVHIVAPGLRVELCWDTTGRSDIDLHLHKPGATSGWFDDRSPAGQHDDCYYPNRKAYATPPDRPNWGYPTSPLSECEGGPEGEYWRDRGACDNPRLDIDNISTPNIPENINVDRPANNATYRVMVHYYGGSVETHPLVNIYCGGHLLGTYGQAPDQLAGFNHGEGESSGLMWRVVDVTTHVTGADTTGCDLTALHPPGVPGGFYVTNDNTDY